MQAARTGFVLDRYAGSIPGCSPPDGRSGTPKPRTPSIEQ